MARPIAPLTTARLKARILFSYRSVAVVVELWNRNKTKGRPKYKYFFPKSQEILFPFLDFVYARKWDSTDDLYRSIDQGERRSVICSHAVERGKTKKAKTRHTSKPDRAH